jgi:hypothetical protein
MGPTRERTLIAADSGNQRADVRALIAITSATLFAVNETLEEALLAQWKTLRSLWGGDDSWVGDSLRPVIESAFVTPELRALFPFTSGNRLCFSRSSYYPFTLDSPCIAAWPGEYIVQALWASTDEPAPELVRTTDLELAITTVIDNLPPNRAVWLGDADHPPD